MYFTGVPLFRAEVSHYTLAKIKVDQRFNNLKNYVQSPKNVPVVSITNTPTIQLGTWNHDVSAKFVQCGHQAEFASSILEIGSIDLQLPQ